jgi:MoxR-like ATPase
MFIDAGVTEFYQKHRSVFEKVVKLEDAINARLYGMESAVECMMLATLTGEPMVMIGPPGTAKSRLVRVFCNLIGLLEDEVLVGGGQTPAKNAGKTVARNPRYFEYLLTQFTEPSELFGYFDIGKLQKQGDLTRMTAGMMQEAEVVFLDEVFNANSAILNSLLTFMNERMFHDRGEIVRTPLRLLFSATNYPPQETNLQAVFDRFLFRVNLASIDADRDPLTLMLTKGWQETHAPPQGTNRGGDFRGLLDAIDIVRADLRSRTTAGSLTIDPLNPLMAKFTDLVRSVRSRELSGMSNRRIVKLTSAVLYLRMLRAARALQDQPVISADDFDAILEYGLDRDDPTARSQLRENWQDPI